MTPDDWQRVSGIFHAALALPPTERETYLAETCGEDAALRGRVDRLLAAARDAGAFGKVPLYPRERLESWLAEVTGDDDGMASPSGAEHAALAGHRTTSDRCGRGLFLALVVAAAAATLVTFSYAAWLLVASEGRVPALGWEAAPSGGIWRINRVAPGGPAATVLEAGDRLIAMNASPPGADAGLLLHRRDLELNDSYTLTIERGGTQERVELTVGAVQSSTPVVYFFVSLVWCVVGLFIGFAQPTTVLARLACVTALAVGFVFLQISVIRSGLLWQPLHAVLGMHFLARFPSGEPTRGPWRATLIVAYGLGGFAAALGLLSHGVALAAGTGAALELMASRPLLFELRWHAALIAFAIAAAGMITALVVNYRRLETEDHRRRLRVLLYGGVIGLAPQLWWAAVSLMTTFTGLTSLPRFDLLVNVSTVAIPLAMAYAVVRHRVLDVRVVVRRSLQYLLAKRALQAILVLPFLALLYILIVNRDRTLAELAADTAGYAVWLALGGLALVYRQRLVHWIDRRFFREAFDRDRLMMQLLDDSRRVDSLHELSSLVSDTLAATLHPSRTFVWYRDPRERSETATAAPAVSATDFPAVEDLLDWLEQRGAAITVSTAQQAGVSPSVLHWLDRHDIEVIAPMTDSSDRLIGALLVGSKRSDVPYDDDDAKLLDAVARQTAVIRENLRLRARLSDAARVRHDVLAHLDERIPDLLKECGTCGRCFDGAVRACPEDGAPLEHSLPVARTIDARYRLERLLGRGGMGAVYAARDSRLGRDVAIKIVVGKGLEQTSTLRRFRREAHAAARLSHPNVVSVYDYGTLEGKVAYIVMEVIRGETLRSVLDREGPLAPGAVYEWFAPLLAGIEAAHTAGIVHRDLKPENVMGWRDETRALAVKLLDLGLAKLRASEQEARESVTQDGFVIGTLGYMSPEQLTGRPVDHRADLFAVGIMLREALTGRRPEPRHLADVERLQQTVLADGLPADLAGLLARCLASEPDARPASADALRARLATLLL